MAFVVNFIAYHLCHSSTEPNGDGDLITVITMKSLTLNENGGRDLWDALDAGNKNAY